MMGFFNAIKSIFDEKELGKQTIQAQIDCLKKLQQIHPEYDMHKHLIEIYLTRLNMRGVDVYNELTQLQVVNETMMFSIFESPYSAEGLGLWILYKENPNIIKRYPEFSERFKLFVDEYTKLVEADKFESLYKQINPTSADKYELFS